MGAGGLLNDPYPYRRKGKEFIIRENEDFFVDHLSPDDIDNAWYGSYTGNWKNVTHIIKDFTTGGRHYANNLEMQGDPQPYKQKHLCIHMKNDKKVQCTWDGKRQDIRLFV